VEIVENYIKSSRLDGTLGETKAGTVLILLKKSAKRVPILGAVVAVGNGRSTGFGASL